MIRSLILKPHGSSVRHLHFSDPAGTLGPHMQHKQVKALIMLWPDSNFRQERITSYNQSGVKSGCHLVYRLQGNFFVLPLHPSLLVICNEISLCTVGMEPTVHDQPQSLWCQLRSFSNVSQDENDACGVRKCFPTGVSSAAMINEVIRGGPVFLARWSKQ